MNCFYLHAVTSEQISEQPEVNKKMFLRLNNLIKFARVSRTICQSAVRLNEDTSKDISGSVATKFQVFRNETGIVFDIEEERRRQEERDEDELEVYPSAFAGINLERKS